MPKAAPTRKSAKTTASKEAKPKAKPKAAKKEEPIEEVEVVATPQKRQAPTRESVELEFDALIAKLDARIEEQRESESKVPGIKWTKSMRKDLVTLKNHSGRAMKQKKPSNRAPNENSGFLKPVQLSTELTKFTGWEPSELRSRVDVTKFICQYIRENDLQDPVDRRKIRADKKLQDLLGYNPKKTSEPLRYYSLQTYLKERGHFIKPEE